MFMAVPHRGSTSADYANILANIANAVTPMATNAMTQLKQDSSYLLRLSARFGNLQESLMFVTVLEAQPTKLAPWLERGSILVRFRTTHDPSCVGLIVRYRSFPHILVG